MKGSEKENQADIDDQIMAQRQAIEQDVAEKQPLVGDKCSLESLVAEYDAALSAPFHSKAQELGKRYAFMRRIRGDGNCFYRAIAFSMCEICLGRSDLVDGKIQALEKWKKTIEDMGYNNLSVSEFFDSFIELLRELKDGMDERSLLDKFNEPFCSNYAVVCLRLITAGFMRQNESMFEGFLENSASLEEYCEREVHPMNHDCDHVSILALLSALGLPVLIEYLDRSKSTGRHAFNVEDDKPAVLFFLYRPGHYDILYPV